MKKISLIVFMFSVNAMAIENQLTICTRDTDLRAIEIFYPTKERVPCKVNYTKNSNNRILWNATYNEGYCEEKAKAFVDKLTQSGWNCRSVLSEPKQ